MEMLTVAILVAIFFVECVGVWQIMRMNRGINFAPEKHKSEIQSADRATMIDKGVYPIKRKTEVEHWEREVARVASRPKFS